MHSLKHHNINTKLVIGGIETFSKKIYDLLSPALLSRKLVWRELGRRIADRLADFGPSAVILFTDVTAGAARYLSRKGIKTIVSIEDLTSYYHQMIRSDPAKIEKIMGILCEELSYANHVITPSYMLTRKLEDDYGVEAMTIPIGLRLYVSKEYAVSRENRYALHVKQINDIRQAMALNNLSRRFREKGITILAHKRGRYANLVKGVEWYRYPTHWDAIEHIRKAFLGVITEFRPAFTLSSIYYHLSLLQPILAIGHGPWLEEARELGINPINDICDVNGKTIRRLYDVAKRLEIPLVHRPLLDII